MKEVLVINSPLFRERLEGYNDDSLPPLGLGYIATNLKNKGIKVSFLDAVAGNIPVAEIIQTIRNSYPSYVVINVFTTNLHLVKEIVEQIQESTRVIIGGGTKYLYQEIFNWSTQCAIDVIIGEGEFAVTAIVQGDYVEVFCNEGEKRVILISPSSPYFPHDISNSMLDHSFFVNEPSRHKLGFNEAYIITSRGCIYNCAFCGSARSLNLDLPVRERSVEVITQEITDLCNLYSDLDSIRVLDDLFLKNDKSAYRAIKIFSNLPVTWRAMAHILSIHQLNDSQLIELKESGCLELFIGIESGSSSILERVHKTSDLSLIKSTIRRLFRVGINVKGFFILGFPHETREDMIQTCNLIAWLKQIALEYGTKFRASVFQFRPYHGTELYNYIVQQDGQITKDTSLNVGLSARIGRHQFNFQSDNYSDVSDEELESFITQANDINQW